VQDLPSPPVGIIRSGNLIRFVLSLLYLPKALSFLPNWVGECVQAGSMSVEAR